MENIYLTLASGEFVDDQKVALNLTAQEVGYIYRALNYQRHDVATEIELHSNSPMSFSFGYCNRLLIILDYLISKINEQMEVYNGFKGN